MGEKKAFDPMGGMQLPWQAQEQAQWQPAEVSDPGLFAPQRQDGMGGGMQGGGQLPWQSMGQNGGMGQNHGMMRPDPRQDRFRKLGLFGQPGRRLY